MAQTLEDVMEGVETQDLPNDILNATADEIERRTKLIENEARFMKNEIQMLRSDEHAILARTNENNEKIKLNKQLPYLVANVVEVLDISPDGDEEEDGAAMDVDAQRKGKCVVIKTTTRQVSFALILRPSSCQLLAWLMRTSSVLVTSSV